MCSLLCTHYKRTEKKIFLFKIKLILQKLLLSYKHIQQILNLAEPRKDRQDIQYIHLPIKILGGNGSWISLVNFY